MRKWRIFCSFWSEGLFFCKNSTHKKKLPPVFLVFCSKILKRNWELFQLKKTLFKLQTFKSSPLFFLFRITSAKDVVDVFLVLKKMLVLRAKRYIIIRSSSFLGFTLFSVFWGSCLVLIWKVWYCFLIPWLALNRVKDQINWRIILKLLF